MKEIHLTGKTNDNSYCKPVEEEAIKVLMKFQQCCEAKFLTTNNIDAITNSTGGNFQRGFLFYIEVIIIFFLNRKQEDIQSRAYLQAIFSWLGCPLHSSVSIFNYFAYLNWLDTATGACPSVHVCLVR